jgi:hypothetical protein
MLTLRTSFFPYAVNNQQHLINSSLKITYARHIQQEIVSAVFFIKPLELLNIRALSSIGTNLLYFMCALSPELNSVEVPLSNIDGWADCCSLLCVLKDDE